MRAVLLRVDGAPRVIAQRARERPRRGGGGGGRRRRQGHLHRPREHLHSMAPVSFLRHHTALRSFLVPETETQKHTHADEAEERALAALSLPPSLSLFLSLSLPLSLPL